MHCHKRNPSKLPLTFAACLIHPKMGSIYFLNHHLWGRYNLTRYKYMLWTCHWVIKDIICIPSFSPDGLFQTDTNLRPRIDQSLNGHRMLTITLANDEHLVESCDDLELWRLCTMTMYIIWVYIYILYACSSVVLHDTYIFMYVYTYKNIPPRYPLSQHASSQTATMMLTNQKVQVLGWFMVGNR